MTMIHRERNEMEQVFKHYGSAILALCGILVTALATDGYVATAFKEAIESFFTSMKAIQAGNPPLGT